MSVLDPIRIHFRGKGFVNRPTQCRNRNGEIDFPTSTAFVDGKALTDAEHPSRYHEHLATTGRRYGVDGRAAPQGLFSENVGWNAGGNQHFIWMDTRVSSVQTERGVVDRSDDALIGSLVEIWGHYNEYLRTTANRARFIDVDPSSRWTPHVMIGHFTFGRRAPSVESPNLFSADVDGSHGARWLRSDALLGYEDHVEHTDLTTAMTFHFVIPRPGRHGDDARHFAWHERANDSAVLRALQAALEADDAIGLAVQYTLLGMTPPEKHESPAIHELFGTIGIARAGEPTTLPAGRLLEPVSRTRSGRGKRRFGPAGVAIADGVATFSLPATVPWIVEAGESRPAPTPALELCLGTSGTRLAVVEPGHHDRDALLHGRIVDVPLEVPWSEALARSVSDEGLVVREAASKHVVLREREMLVDAGLVNLYVDHPDRRRGDDRAEELRLQSFVRGRPASVGPIRLKNVTNPGFRARHLRDAMERDASGGELAVVEPCTREAAAALAPIRTDAQGNAVLVLRGCQPGSARLWFETPEDLARDDGPRQGASLEDRYDEVDATGFWSTANAINVRVLADDWRILDVRPANIDYAYLYRHGLMIYELLYPFMALSVFSLADEPKFETYARLMFQMCDRRNRGKTYYMPSTRDLTPAQTELMFIYMGNVAEQNANVFDAPARATPAAAPPPTLAEARTEITALLRLAVELEMSLMLQYLYAGYSVPNYKTGRALVERGAWTAEQLALACGDGTERPRHGWRGTLLEIAHEEMIHFHVVENLLLAIGEPFYVPLLDWPNSTAHFPLGAETALEPFSLHTLARFVHFERPATANVAGTGKSGAAVESVGALYTRIRGLIEEHPGLITREEWRPLWREHHLFTLERLDQRHPDFQLQVYNQKSALAALDFIVSQGEGRLELAGDATDAHYHRFRRMTARLAEEMGASTTPWMPAYPALRNPTLNGDEIGWREIVDPQTRAIAEINEECFSLMLFIMTRHHVDIPSMSLRRSRLMNASIDVMTGMVRPLSIQLMSMPSGHAGYTAGPTFRPRGSYEAFAALDTRGALAELSATFGRLHRKASKIEMMPRAPLGLMAFYEAYFDELARRKVLSMTTE